MLVSCLMVRQCLADLCIISRIRISSKYPPTPKAVSRHPTATDAGQKTHLLNVFDSFLDIVTDVPNQLVKSRLLLLSPDQKHGRKARQQNGKTGGGGNANEKGTANVNQRASPYLASPGAAYNNA